MLGNDSRLKSFLDVVLFVRPMTNPRRQEIIGLSAMPDSLAQA